MWCLPQERHIRRCAGEWALASVNSKVLIGLLWLVAVKCPEVDVRCTWKVIVCISTIWFFSRLLTPVMFVGLYLRGRMSNVPPVVKTSRGRSPIGGK